MMISVEQSILIFILSGVYYGIGRFIERIAIGKSVDDAMKYTTILLWPLLLVMVFAYSIVKFVLVVIGGGNETK